MVGYWGDSDPLVTVLPAENSLVRQHVSVSHDQIHGQEAHLLDLLALFMVIGKYANGFDCNRLPIQVALPHITERPTEDGMIAGRFE